MNDLFGNNPPVIKRNPTAVNKSAPAKPAPVKSGAKPCPGKTDHPSHDLNEKHRHEEAYVTSSAGGEITEGCIEHYFDRVVSEEEEPTIEMTDVDTDLAKYIIMGEILARPKFRR